MSEKESYDELIKLIINLRHQLIRGADQPGNNIVSDNLKKILDKLMRL